MADIYIYIYIYAYVGIYIRCSGCSRFALKAASKVKVTRPESLALSRCRDYEVNVCQVGVRICRDEVRRDRVRDFGARESVVQAQSKGVDLAIPQGLEHVRGRGMYRNPDSGRQPRLQALARSGLVNVDKEREQALCAREEAKVNRMRSGQ